MPAGSPRGAVAATLRSLSYDPCAMPTSIDVFAKAREFERLEQLKAARELGAFPYFHVLEGPTLPVVEMEGARRIMLGSNNYLGLTGDARVREGARRALERYGTGLTGSRFLNGTIDLHVQLEQELTEWLGTEDAIVFTTGHQANLGVLGTILGPGDTVIADSGDHASILDGCILSRAKMRFFKHNRLELLEKQLGRAEDDGGGVLVVVDGVYSMEGDVAPLVEIADLCARFGARLMVDEAHALGRARRAWRGDLRAVWDRGPRRSSDGDVFQIARFVRGRDRRPQGRDRVPADRLATVHLHRRGGAGRCRSDPGRGPYLPLVRRSPSCSRGFSTTPAICIAA